MARAEDMFGFWLDQAGRYPVLPKDEQLRLGRIIQDENSTEDQREKAIEKMVRHNLKLIPKVCLKFMGTKKSYNYGDCNTPDLVQIGVFGLRRAAEKFDPTRGYAFSTYALPWIRQAVQRYAMRNLSQIYVPESTLRDVFECGESGSFKKPKGLEDRKWQRIKDGYFAVNTNSTDAPIKSSDDDVSCLLDTIPSPEKQDNKPAFTFEEILDGINISDKERLILQRRFMENMTLLEIGQEFGLCRESMRKKIEKICKNIRKQKTLKGQRLLAIA